MMPIDQADQYERQMTQQEEDVRECAERYDAFMSSLSEGLGIRVLDKDNRVISDIDCGNGDDMMKMLADGTISEYISHDIDEYLAERQDHPEEFEENGL